MITIMPDGKGGAALREAPLPELFPRSALCRMTHSLISAGTEKGIIKSCAGKSAAFLKKNNMRLGYLGAGIVEKTMGDMSCKAGDRVAYYGAPYVTHSEYVVVPEKLLFPLPENAPNEWGAFMGIAAIAMHGFRMGKLSLGEVCVVVGAGIIGNICAQLALFAGCRVALCDYERARLDIFKKCAPADDDYICTSPNEAEKALRHLGAAGGADAVFLCMGTASDEPMAQAVRLIRPGGRIVIVGTLDIQIPREEFFMKEAEVAISRAAGPGRYDASYEKEGRDYPMQYVRWTEGRNAAESLRLIAAGRLRVDPMISSLYPVRQFKKAYENILKGKPEMGYILDWSAMK